MVAADYPIANLRERAKQKQDSRSADAQRLANNDVSAKQMRRANHVLGDIDMSSFRMVAIGKRRIGAR